MTLTIAAMHISYNCGGDDFFTRYILRYCSGGAVAWFFFMAAFWYFKDYDYSIAWTKFAKRLKTLLIPYFVWNMLSFLSNNGLAVLKAGTFVGYEKTILEGMIFTRFDGLEMMPVDGPTWYVIRLLSYFLIAPIIYFFIKDKCGGIVAIIVTFIFTRKASYYYFDAWLCLFMVGAYIGIHYRELYAKLFTRLGFFLNHNLLGVAGLIAVYAGITVLWHVYVNSPINLHNSINLIIGYFIAAIPLVIFEVPDISKEFSGYSFAIYCGHMVIVPVINRYLWGKVSSVANVGGTPWAIFLLLMVCVIVIFGCKIMNRISPRLTALFTGGRLC